MKNVKMYLIDDGVILEGGYSRHPFSQYAYFVPDDNRCGFSEQVIYPEDIDCKIFDTREEAQRKIDKMNNQGG